MFSGSLFLWLVFQEYISEVLGGSHQGCQYEILGLDDTITINETVGIGTTLYNLTVIPIGDGAVRRRKKRRGSPTSDEFDIILNTISQYFEMNFVNNHHEVVVKSCLEGGHKEVLYFFINNKTLDDGSCDMSTLRINVVETIPSFNLPRAVNISVDTCVPPTALDVIQIQFDNGGNCSSWNCSVNASNDVKLFWVGTGNTVQTYLSDTNFNFTYKLLITCFPSDTPEVTENSKERKRGDPSGDETLSGDKMLDVMFIDTGPCTSTVLSVTTSLLGVTEQASLTGYLDDPSNAALVSSLGGVREDPSGDETLSGDEMFDVMFIDTGPCSSTLLSVTTSLLEVTEQASLTGYLDDPSNAALVSSLGGVTAGVAVGAGLSILAARYCSAKRITAIAE